ncbi:MAG: SulP family inorganic anion transporter [Thermoleophilaceae bacterium]|nr:SulP family inorganic anion transporter [Thermoleophilaceae bacterium]
MDAAPADPRGRLSRVFPIVGWLPSYKKSDFRPDFLAGVIITCLLVPEGMAYAQIAGMPPQTAFYVAPPALLLYAIFASSRKLVVVVSSTQAALSAGAIGLVATVGTAQYVELTAALALLVGLITMIAGVFRFGAVAQFFSPSVLVGFVTGLALLISVKQLPSLLGIEPGKGDFWERLLDVIVHLGDVHGPTLLLGALSIAVMLTTERVASRLPSALAALLFGLLASRLFDLAGHGVEVINEIPGGLAAPQIPDVGVTDVTLLFASAVGIALVNFAEGSSIAREFAQKDGVRLDENKELLGLGAANVGAGLFQGFAIGASLSKSSAAYRQGMRTQMAGIVAAGLTALVALFLTGLFEGLPEATLAGIVIVAVSGMIRLGRISSLRRLNMPDFGLAVIATLAVMSLETLFALIFAVALSIGLMVARAARAPVRRLGRMPGGHFADLDEHPEARAENIVLVVRLDSELFFANADAVAEQVYADATAGPHIPRGVVLDLEATNDPDVPSGEALIRLAERLRAAGIPLALARVHEPVIELFDRVGVVDAIGREFVTGDRVEDTVERLEAAIG